jgi:hypothetical protein
MKAQVIQKVIQMIPRKDLSKSDLSLISMMYEAGVLLGVELLIIQEDEA